MNQLSEETNIKEMLSKLNGFQVSYNLIYACFDLLFFLDNAMNHYKITPTQYNAIVAYIHANSQRIKIITPTYNTIGYTIIQHPEK